ncbi:MAG: hypothetical protein IJO88_05720 [Oscillospiraceae bacterium]|nr:hypothetical protein [Oscillospiraceae bacterium]
MRKRTIYSEFAYVIALCLLTVGAALMERADMGMSMVIAPAYVLYLKLSTFLPFVTFGMMVYTVQALLIVGLGIALRRFKLSYLFVFCTAVIYGFMLDGMMLLTALLPATVVCRVVWYVLGMVLCSAGVAMMFHTYFSPEAYELVVKEVAAEHGASVGRVKTVYDLSSCAVAIVLSFLFFGLWHFEGVKLGTVICALVNGWMIGKLSAWYDTVFDFRDCLKLRKYFE